MEDGTIYQYSIQRCIGDIIYNIATFSRVVPIRATNTTNNDKIILTGLVL